MLKWIDNDAHTGRGTPHFLTWFRSASVFAFLAMCLGESGCAAREVGASSTKAAKSLITASFDCGKAVSNTEKLICSDTQTSALDGKLQKVYKTALMSTNAPGRKALVQEQRNWIKYTRGSCLDTGCLRQVYTDRIAVLARNEKIIVDGEVFSYCELPTDGNHIGVGNCVNVLPYRDSNDRISSFNQSLAQQKQTGKIITCSRLIDLPVGNINSNESFGGVCLWQDGPERRAVEICNADMTGKFDMQALNSNNVTDKRLINFTYTHCYGGY